MNNIPLEQLIVGIVLVSPFGYLVEYILDRCTKRPDKPARFTDEEWGKIVGSPDQRIRGGGAIGLLERILFLVCFLVSAYTLIAAWLVFKLGAKWETWGNIVKISDYFGPKSGIEGLIVRRQLGTWVNARHVIGLLLNLLIALLGAYIAAHLPWDAWTV